MDPKKKNEKEHLEFLKRIQQTFYYWIDNPNEEIINFIKERNILFIHKAGDEGIPLNYRPISINNTLARFFLKLIYKGIEESWNLVSDSQFGFKKKLDTRIAEIIEDIDHFLWDCPFYGKNRKIWINELIQINKNNKQLKNNILDIIRNKDSLFILSLVNDKENYDSLLKFLNKNLEIRAVRGN
ncbi:RNA-directed DNA polymerase from transposon x-element-like protein-related [Anaeramoeba flamelloides]|uniref:RNA-directed DNA polymerase from transposon x-element-like protein-related n=1 Tax=Anaeramoeba flamelloides TaxID=1746091 RepID=A0ABQ8YT75_9EUKA|nr:RNA-directed DNA polymerase from transposon x-element-like protein-related [Anaeramoeba flamelloides]